MKLHQTPAEAEEPTTRYKPDIAKRQAALDARAEQIYKDTGGACGWRRGDSNYLQARYDCDSVNQASNNEGTRGGQTITKLTPDIVRQIRHTHKGGASCRQMAVTFNISRQTIWDVVNRRTWADVV